MAAATNVIPLALPAQAIPRKTSRSTMTYLSCEEVLSVLKAARARSVRDWAMVLVAYRHGLRASEVCGLKLSDVNPKDQTIRVARLKGSMLTTQPMLPHRGQPLLDELAALRAWLKVRPADGSDFLFTSQKGGRRDRTQFFRVFRAVAESVDLPREKRPPPTF